MKKGYLAFDFGASSGRMLLGVIEGEKLDITEVHRFMNEPVNINETMYWDFPRLFHEMKQGLKKAAKLENVTIESIGIDTWGVDGAWLDQSGQIINLPIHYRDSRTSEIIEEFDKKLSREEVYQETGIQWTTFNTIYQIYYDKTYNEIIQSHGKSWLFMPDLFNYLLTGKKYNEYTEASTGALLNPYTREYSDEVFDKLGVEKSCMQELIQPGSVVGELLPEIQEETGLGAVKVVAVGSHDTASAVAGTPLQGEDEIYLVCGTWCLMGMELENPVISDITRKYNLTNEAGVEGKIRLLKNINGLWFLQQLKKVWNEKGYNIDFPDIIEATKKCEHNYSVDADDQRFMNPQNMEKEIVANCLEKYGVELTEIGEIAKAAYNGLSELYKQTVQQFEEVTGKEITTIRMIGGGIKDKYLCERVADATNKKVIAGPIEASAIGNITMQMKATDNISSLQEARELIAKSFESQNY